MLNQKVYTTTRLSVNTQLGNNRPSTARSPRRVGLRTDRSAVPTPQIRFQVYNNSGVRKVYTRLRLQLPVVVSISCLRACSIALDDILALVHVQDLKRDDKARGFTKERRVAPNKTPCGFLFIAARQGGEGRDEGQKQYRLKPLA